MVESGAITPVVEETFRLDEVVDILTYSESGRATGKVVIKAHTMDVSSRDHPVAAWGDGDTAAQRSRVRRK